MWLVQGTHSRCFYWCARCSTANNACVGMRFLSASNHRRTNWCVWKGHRTQPTISKSHNGQVSFCSWWESTTCDIRHKNMRRFSVVSAADSRCDHCSCHNHLSHVQTKAVGTQTAESVGDTHTCAWTSVTKKFVFCVMEKKQNHAVILSYSFFWKMVSHTFINLYAPLIRWW